MEPTNVDVAVYLAAWKPTGLAKYKPPHVSAQTFEAALKNLFVATHKNPSAPDTALEANDATPDVPEVALKLRTNLAIMTALRPAREAQDERQVSAPRSQAPERDQQRTTSRMAKAAALEAAVQELRARQSEQSEQTEQSYSDRRQRSGSWLTKSLRVIDPIDLESRFIFSWIALNTLYGVPLSCLECVSAKPREKPKQGRDDLLWFIDTICRLDSDERRIWSVLNRQATTIDEAVDSRFLLRDYWEVDKASDAQLEKRKQDDHKKIADARKTEEPLRQSES